MTPSFCLHAMVRQSETAHGSLIPISSHI